MQKWPLLLSALSLQACASRQELPPLQSVQMEQRVLALGNKEMAARLGSLRACVAGFLVRTAAETQLELNLLVETAFVSCASEESSLRAFTASTARDPTAAASALSDYRTALKRDMLQRLAAAGR